MIQEIYPNVFENQYIDEKCTENDYVIIFKNDKIAVKDDGEKIDFFKQKEIKEDDVKPIYAFSIDNEKYFLLNIYSDINITEDITYISLAEFRKRKPKTSVFAGMTAYHLSKWYENNQYCGKCGNKTKIGKEERVIECNKCGNKIYPKIMPAVIVAVTNEDKILVTRYKGREYKGYALIAGFNEIGETLEETVKREVKEEVGLNVKNIKYYNSQPWGIAQDLLVGYFCEVDGNDKIVIDEEELSYGEWISRETLDIVNEDFSLTNDMLYAFKENKLSII